jgi:hypothetical protein
VFVPPVNLPWMWNSTVHPTQKLNDITDYRVRLIRGTLSKAE